ncbi:succinylglutamate desuccinylase/aspartoacylase family protein [Labrys monachus]|uniref:Deacylase n=1 Tax=Labrys monachus TaxID=217067 RepID=A0ABU0F7Q8_9HYPH|nr:succinylglutamate desuccinylase/aspartoacylase family protein [Labrys monachus]MDQ0390643.1 putative deacylase [Labrys monachus]
MHSGFYHALDFDRDGKTLSHLGVPFSIDRSPYFHVKVPVCVVRNGEGPSVLLMAGNHGDEYEGELCLARLIRKLDPARMRGRVTILPLTNAPAVLAARRCSPLDGGNLNRAFPGDAAGNATSRIAYALEHDLFPRHDVVLDLHSGGTSMEHLPCALIERQADEARFERSLALMRALGLGHGFIADNGPQAPTSMGAAGRAGAIGLSGEFGGGGTVTPRSMAATARAIDRLLVALGIVETPVLAPAGNEPEPAPMRILSLASHSQAIYAGRHGWFEPAVELGAEVAAGDVAGWYHDLERLGETEEALHFAQSGIVISRRLHTMCESGDCLIQVARPVEG